MIQSLVDTKSLSVGFSEDQKSFSVNEVKTTPGKFKKNLSVIVFSPESLASIKSGPEARRDLVDEALFQTSESASTSIDLFKRALRQRNALLRQLLDQPGDVGLLETLEVLTDQFVTLAAKLTSERLSFLKKIRPLLETSLRTIMGDKTLGFSFRYLVSDEEATDWNEEQVFERITRRIKDPNIRAGELSLGASLVGPHKHHVSFLFNENDSRIFCSQGQQRAVILAFKMSEMVYHDQALKTSPVLLLDDVLSEFDVERRKFLIGYLGTAQTQTFLTTTDETRILDGAQEFRIDRGRLV